jgi:hypothetical protein
MKLWIQWGLLITGWILSTVSIRMWPKLSEINQSLDLPEGREIHLSTSEDLIAIIFFKPFHYMIGFICLLFFIFVVSSLTRKIIYECEVAYLFRRIPYESLILLILLLILYIEVVQYFSYLALVLTGIMFIYDFITYLPKRKKEAVYVREG